MQCFELSRGSWQQLVHFQDSHLWHDTKMQVELVYCDELEHLAQTNVDGIDPIAFEYKV